MDNNNSLLGTVIASLVAYLSPIGNMVFCLTFVFILNFIVGLISSIRLDKEAFKLRKFLVCMLENMVYYVTVSSVFTIGEKMGNMDGALQCVSVITYSIIYFYTANLFRNLHKLFPNAKPIEFIYYVICFEFVKHIPYMENFLKRESNGKN